MLEHLTHARHSINSYHCYDWSSLGNQKCKLSKRRQKVFEKAGLSVREVVPVRNKSSLCNLPCANYGPALCRHALTSVSFTHAQGLEIVQQIWLLIL